MSTSLQHVVEGNFEAVSPTLAALIKAARICPCEVNPEITEQRFSLVGPVANVSAMVALSQEDLGCVEQTTAEYEAKIDSLGYRSATLAELLTWAEETWNRDDSVVALGSLGLDQCEALVVPYLCAGGDRRLRQHWGHSQACWYGDNFHFLVVRK